MANRHLYLSLLLMILCPLSAQVAMVRPCSPANTVIFFDLHDVILKRDTRKRLKLALKNPIGALKLGVRVMTNKNWRNGEQLQIELRRKGDNKQAEVVRQLSAAYKVDTDVFKILQELKAKGYTLCMASNIGAGHLNDLLDKCHPRNKAKYPVTLRDVFALFDDLVFVDYESQDVISKPDHRYFALLSNRCEQKNIIFVDDNKKNVAAADACGLHAIRFSSAEKLTRDLKNLGIL
jgi:FMN phosphatase YigB (HAD superfamily)